MRFVLIVAQTLDGRITRHDVAGTDWTSPADKAWFRHCLREFDSSVMGRVTYEVSKVFILQNITGRRRRLILTGSPAQFAADHRENQLEFTAESPREIADRLSQAGCQNCAILGGTRVHDEFLQAGLVDEIWTTLEPQLFGTGTPLLQTPHDIRLTLIDHHRLDDSDSLLLKYRVQR
jgi:dihydrofolate reductase